MSERLYELLATEGKSKGTLSPVGGTVRVFVDRDLFYGVFIAENKLFELLTPAQQADYLEDSAARLMVSREVAQQVLDLGVPRTRRVLA